MNDLEFLKALGSTPEGAELAKAITASSGFVGYNLEPEAALILPYFAGLRARVPSDPAAEGADNATWKAQLGYGSFGFGTWGSAETSTGLATTPSATQFQAPYEQQAVNGDVSFISMLKARGFDDPMNVETSNVLAALLVLEEYILMSANSAALSVPAPVVQASTLQTAATFAAGTWHVKVTAVTNEGAVNNASSNNTRGESNSSSSIAVVVPSGGSDFLDVQIPVIANAVGYKIYAEHAAGGGTFYLCDPATTLRYRKITSGATDLGVLGDKIIPNTTGQTFVTVNHVQIYAIPPNTQPTAPSADNSANGSVFEGLLAWCTKSTIYSQSVGSHYNVDMDGAPLTTLGTGVLELDNILENQWVFNKMSPSLIIGSAKTIRSLGNAIIKTAQVPTYRVDISSEQGSFQGGIFLGGYTNKFAATMLPGQKPIIPVWSHPYLPDGTLMILSEDIPSASYKYSRKGKAFSLDVLAPYTYWELARTAISVPFAILWSETLKCYHPLAQSAIQGIRVDA